MFRWDDDSKTEFMSSITVTLASITKIVAATEGVVQPRTYFVPTRASDLTYMVILPSTMGGVCPNNGASWTRRELPIP